MAGRGGGYPPNLKTPVEYTLTGVYKRPTAGHRDSPVKSTHGRKILNQLKKQQNYADQELYSSRHVGDASSKYDDFFKYSTYEEETSITEYQTSEDSDGGGGWNGNISDWDNGTLPARPNHRPVDLTAKLFQDVSLNVTDYLSLRSLGSTHVKQPQVLQPWIRKDCYTVESDQAMKHMLTNQILQEKPLKVENINKVFSSQWLSDKQVIFGTKCNKLMVLDVQKEDIITIPSLSSTSRSVVPDAQCGIHSIEINPGRTLLATGGKNPNDVAVYSLPTMDPICVGEMAHTDWLFGLAWVDDEFVVSGSRDNCLAVWNVGREFDRRSEDTSGNPSYSFIKAAEKKECKSAQKVRDVVYNRRQNEVACVSLNAYLHLWDISYGRFHQKLSKKLPFNSENVCLSVHEDYGLYAVGSKSHTTLLDARTVQCIKKIPSKYTGTCIRSTNFYSTLLSIGTGAGTILFYDLRAGKYLDTTNNTSRSATLKASSGWSFPEDEVFPEVYRQRQTPAIYTHCMDMSGTRLFAAGGPLPVHLTGNYIGLFH